MTDMEKSNITPHLGLDSDAMEKTVDAFVGFLADEHVLYMKLRNYHWNVTGPYFKMLHELFEEQYTTLANTIDEIAERVRTYGIFTPGTMQEMINTARLQEASPGEFPSARAMVNNLVNDHEMIIRNLREAIDLMDDIDNDGAEDYFIGLLQTHQEMAWMLRAHLQDWSD
ncbi:MAG: Dps family protein [Chloroflexota bacterium]